MCSGVICPFFHLETFFQFKFCSNRISLNFRYHQEVNPGPYYYPYEFGVSSPAQFTVIMPQLIPAADPLVSRSSSGALTLPGDRDVSVSRQVPMCNRSPWSRNSWFLHGLSHVSCDCTVRAHKIVRVCPGKRLSSPKIWSTIKKSLKCPVNGVEKIFIYLYHIHTLNIGVYKYVCNQKMQAWNKSLKKCQQTDGPHQWEVWVGIECFREALGRCVVREGGAGRFPLSFWNTFSGAASRGALAAGTEEDL